MAWNEPGGGGDKDPWGNRGNDGPPDLDEAFRKLQNSLSEMFGGGSGSGSGGGGTGGAGLNLNLIWFGIGALFLVWLVMGVYQLDEQERGVVLRFGELHDDSVGPGLHWNPPLVDVVLSDNVTQVRTREHVSEMLTEDENIVRVKMSVQYVINDVAKYLLRVRSPDQSLYQATESALRHEVGSAIMNDVLTEGRALLGQRVQERIQTYMDRYNTGIQVTKVQIDETAPPDAVRAAFDDVIKAREDEVRFRNEANAYANQIVPEARGQAQRLREEALAYQQRVIAQSRGEAERFNKLHAEYEQAPEVTRERIYLDTIESVFSNSTKVMVDIEGGNNLMYLPLDKILEQSGQSPGVRANSGGNLLNGSSADRSEASRRPVTRRADRNSR